MSFLLELSFDPSAVAVSGGRQYFVAGGAENAKNAHADLRAIKLSAA